jgi:hypothetical protein
MAQELLTVEFLINPATFCCPYVHLTSHLDCRTLLVSWAVMKAAKLARPSAPGSKVIPDGAPNRQLGLSSGSCSFSLGMRPLT